MSSSRRERRAFAKQLGMLAKKESFQEMAERFRRSNEAGQHLHTHYLQEVKNLEIEKEISDSEPSTEEGFVNPYDFLGKR